MVPLTTDWAAVSGCDWVAEPAWALIPDSGAPASTVSLVDGVSGAGVVKVKEVYLAICTLVAALPPTLTVGDAMNPVPVALPVGCLH